MPISWAALPVTSALLADSLDSLALLPSDLGAEVIRSGFARIV